MNSLARSSARVPDRALSHLATCRRAVELMPELDWSTVRIADVGAGRGHLSRLLGETLRGLELEPSEHVFACDLFPEHFEYSSCHCETTPADGRVPFADASFDVTFSIEVVEHVEDQFAFMRELARVTKPGGTVIVSTPNVLNANSRIRTLVGGFPALFDPLPLDAHDPRLLGGHIHPISPYFLAYVGLRSGLVDPVLTSDRTKSSAAILSVLMSPLFLAGRIGQRLRLRRKAPKVADDNAGLLRMQNGWDLLTGRTAVMRMRRPE